LDTDLSEISPSEEVSVTRYAEIKSDTFVLNPEYEECLSSLK